MMRASASRFGLLQACQWWARPEVEAPPLPGSDDATLGTEVHRLMERQGEGLDEATPAAVRLYAAWERCEAAAGPWRHEVAYALDVATGGARILPPAAHRDYSAAGPGEIVGTADLVDRDREWRCPLVADLKTGRQDDAPRAADHPQMRLLALLVARADGADDATAVLYYPTEDGVDEDRAHFDALDLAAIESDLAAAWARIPCAAPQPGRHCSHPYPCPAVAVCPAMSTTTTALVALAGTAPLVITVDNAPLLYARLGQVRAAADAVEAALKAHADATGGIVVAPGKVWCGADEVRESVALDGPEGAEAEAILAQHDGLDAAIKLKRTATWSDLEAHLKAQHPGREGAPIRKAILAALRTELCAANAIKSSSSRVYRERKAKE